MTLLVILLILGGIGFWLMSLYNGLIKKRNNVQEALADVSTLLKQRFDMIPNLVNIVKGYAKHEKGVFEKVTELRASMANAKTPGEIDKAENAMAGVLKSIFAVAENYPELKANENFLNLQDTLKQLEDEIQKSRRYYNAVVKDFNNALMVFPTNIIAPMLGFKAEEYFKVKDEEKENVKVEF